MQISLRIAVSLALRGSRSLPDCLFMIVDSLTAVALRVHER